MKKYLLYKDEIEGLKDVGETIKVIEKVSASFIHLLKEQVLVLKTYRQECQRMLRRLSLFYWNENHPLLAQRQRGKKSLIIMTGNEGIVGGLYHNIVNEAISRKNDYQYLWVLGTKGEEYLREEKVKTERLSEGLSPLPRAEEMQKISSFFFDQFQEKNLQKIDILYPQFFSFAQQKPTIIQFLPFDILKNQKEDIKKDTEKNQADEGFPIFEPSKKEIFSFLLKKFISIFFAQIIFETKLSEFSARMTTAEHAGAKTKEIIKKLNLEFLKERRWTITQKQIESFSVHQII